MMDKKMCLSSLSRYFGNLTFILMLGLVLVYCTHTDPAPCSKEDCVTIEHVDLKATNDGILALRNIDDREERIQMIIRTQEDYHLYIARLVYP